MDVSVGVWTNCLNQGEKTFSNSFKTSSEWFMKSFPNLMSLDHRGARVWTTEVPEFGPRSCQITCLRCHCGIKWEPQVFLLVIFWFSWQDQILSDVLIFSFLFCSFPHSFVQLLWRETLVCFSCWTSALASVWAGITWTTWDSLTRTRSLWVKKNSLEYRSTVTVKSLHQSSERFRRTHSWRWWWRSVSLLVLHASVRFSQNT